MLIQTSKPKIPADLVRPDLVGFPNMADDQAQLRRAQASHQAGTVGRPRVPGQDGQDDLVQTMLSPKAAQHGERSREHRDTRLAGVVHVCEEDLRRQHPAFKPLD